MDWSAECETVQNNAPRAENETLMQMDSGHARPAERLAVVAPALVRQIWKASHRKERCQDLVCGSCERRQERRCRAKELMSQSQILSLSG